MLLIIVSGCGSAPKPTVSVPPNADLKADVMFHGTGSSRTIEVSFYFSTPVAPGDKSEPKLDILTVEEALLNGQPLKQSTNAVGRTIYTAENPQVGRESVINARLNGREYEGRVLPQTTLPNKSATAVMVPK